LLEVPVLPVLMLAPIRVSPFAFDLMIPLRVNRVTEEAGFCCACMTITVRNAQTDNNIFLIALNKIVRKDIF
jgi:hypothetical protein